MVTKISPGDQPETDATIIIGSKKCFALLDCVSLKKKKRFF